MCGHFPFFNGLNEEWFPSTVCASICLSQSLCTNVTHNAVPITSVLSFAKGMRFTRLLFFKESKLPGIVLNELLVCRCNLIYLKQFNYIINRDHTFLECEKELE